VQRTVLALHQDAGEAEAEQQEAERERERAQHRAAGGAGRALGPHHPHAECGHPEGLAARRPRVAEIGELPGDEDDRDDDVFLAPRDVPAGHHAHHVGNPGQREREYARAHHGVDGIGEEP
jgi:hypothetical protein